MTTMSASFPLTSDPRRPSSKDAKDEPKAKAGDKAKGDTPKPLAKVAAAGKGKKAPVAAASPFDGLPLELNDVVSAERNWFAVRHPLYEFMVRHYHPDIRPFAAGAGAVAAAAA